MPGYVYYLKLDGIAGEVIARGYLGWIEVASWSTPNSMGGSTAARLDDAVRFTAPLQAGITQINAYCAQGHQIQSAEVDVVKAGRTVISVKFDNVSVTSCSVGGGAGGGAAMAEFSISFETKKFTRMLDPGDEGSVSPMGWNLVK